MTQTQFIMTPSQLDILDKQRASWDRFSPGWDSWDSFTMGFLDAQGRAIVERITPTRGGRILDIATGTGEPAATLAALDPEASVVGLDISTRMLAIAERKARSKGLDNFTTVVGDASDLPFGDNHFDAISCRLGFMFFPNPARAAREMQRVLKPGGRVVTTVWGQPEHNPWVTILMRAIKNHFTVPVAPQGAPGMFRCAAPDAIGSLMREAGLHTDDDEVLHGQVRCSSPDEYFRFMNEVVPPVVAVLQDAPEQTMEAIRREVFSALEEKRDGDVTAIEWGARIVSAQKLAS